MTCVAMLLGVPVSEIHSEFHVPLWDEDSDFDEYEYHQRKAEEYGFTVEKCYTNDILQWGYIYFCVTPSLNLQAYHHYVLFDCRCPERGTILFDPNHGLPDTKYYHLEKDDGLAIELMAYAPEFKFTGI